MTVSSINSATFLSDTIIWLRDRILANVTDPLFSTRDAKEKFCLTEYPKRNVTYPIITVKDKGQPRFQRGGMRSSVTINWLTIEIRVWGRNVKERDEISQDVIDDLRSIQHTATSGTEAIGLFDFKITAFFNVPPPAVGEETTKSKIIHIEYMVFLGE